MLIKTQVKLMNDQGMSLVEVIVAMGILSVISLGIMRSMEGASKANKSMKQNLALVQIQTRLGQLMRDEDACTLTVITNGGVTTEAQATTGANITSVFNRANAAIYTVGSSNNIGDGLRLTSIQVRGYDASTNMAQLQMSFEREAASASTTTLGGRDITASVPVVLRRDPADPTTGPFVDCVADQGSMMALACASIGGWYDEAGDQRCHNIFIPLDTVNPGSAGTPIYGITSEGGINIQDGPLRVGNGVATPGTLDAAGSIYAENSITSAAGGITATTGDINAAAGNILAQDNITSATGNISATAGSITAQQNITATAGNITATAGSITAQQNLTATAGNITATAGNVNAIAGYVDAGNYRLRGCPANQIGILRGGGASGVQCIPAGNLCPNRNDEIRSMNGFQSDGMPHCQTVLTIPNGCTAPAVVRRISYPPGSSAMQVECCTPSCPATNTYCSGDRALPTNNCPATCTATGTKPRTPNYWASVAGSYGQADTIPEASCQGKCAVVGANTGHATIQERCVRGECGGDNSCSPGLIRETSTPCTFTCSMQNTFSEITSSTTLDFSNQTLQGDIEMHIIGGGGGGTGGYDDLCGVCGGNYGPGGSAATLVSHTLAADGVDRCSIIVGNGGSGGAQGLQGSSGSSSSVVCRNVNNSVLASRTSTGGLRGGPPVSGGTDHQRPGDNGYAASFYTVSSGNLLGITSAGGTGAYQSGNCTPGSGPGAGGGGGANAWGNLAGQPRQRGCNGHRGKVIFRYQSLQRDTPYVIPFFFFGP